MGGRRHPTDWERQREQLSAYIDGELSAAERAELERHIPDCAECQEALGELRRVHDLLAALPMPKAPRSFALPLDTLRDAHTDARPEGPQPPARQPAPRRSRARLTQWAGAIAAAIGLFLLLGGVATGLLGFNARPSAAAGQSSDNRATGAQSQTTGTMTPASATPGQRTPDLVNTKNPGNDGQTPSATGAPTPKATSGATLTSHNGEPEFPILPVTGAGLLTLGAGVYLVGRAQRRREERAATS
jgi:Putative zinc-finger